MNTTVIIIILSALLVLSLLISIKCVKKNDRLEEAVKEARESESTLEAREEALKYLEASVCEKHENCFFVAAGMRNGHVILGPERKTRTEMEKDKEEIENRYDDAYATGYIFYERVEL